MSTIPHIRPLYEPYLNGIQIALLRAYSEWKQEPFVDCEQICAVLNQFANVFPVRDSKILAKSLVYYSIADTEENAKKFCEIFDLCTATIRSASFDFFISQICPESVKAPPFPDHVKSSVYKVSKVGLFVYPYFYNGIYLFFSTDKGSLVVEIDKAHLKELDDALSKASLCLY